ncbi:hypothetical protein ABS362_12985 [Pontibacter populi]|uniref:Uncharacterized protein n=1 Tax=Pontibacter populi TaxID=890055 RepID=A0ABV1RVP4_9BACT
MAEEQSGSKPDVMLLRKLSGTGFNQRDIQDLAANRVYAAAIDRVQEVRKGYFRKYIRNSTLLF